MNIGWDTYCEEQLIQAAKEMALAARTAPKGRGRDELHILIMAGEDKDRIADKMLQIGETKELDFFVRDAGTLRKTPVLLLIGTRSSPLEVKNCGNCGWENCQENRERGTNPCAFSIGDLGIAIGSAVSLAARKHVDNRVQFTVGKAAVELKLFPSAVKVAFGIPLSATGKSPFFDRK